MSVKLLTFNCRGLGGIEKRRDVLNYLKQNNFSIYILQDTHFTNDDLHLVRSIWGYEVFLSPGKSDSRGVATLFNNNFEFKINKTEHDDNGKYLIIDMNIENKYNLLLINVYGPNRDSPAFYENISKIIDQYEGDFIIMGGDFNLVQNFSIDFSSYVNINNPNARNKLLNIKTEYDLEDPWRIQHENTKRYTWFGQNSKKGRLDFFLISKEAMNFVEISDINQGYRSDHSITEISLSF